MDERADRPVLFLSYSHADRARAERIADALRGHDFDVWWDAMIEGGARFAARIREALDQADVIIVLWSRHSVDSDWVCDEAAQGRERHRLVPITLDGSEPPLGFRQYQTISFERWRGRPDSPELARLLDAIRASLAGEASRSAAPSPSRPSIDRRTAIVAASAAAVTAGGLGAWRAGWLGEQAPPHSIAVLPFRNLSGDSGQDYLSLGIAEQVRTALSRIGALQVLAAMSSETAAREGGDARQVAGRLDVAYLLDGSVQRVGDTLRIASTLTDGRSGFSLWSTTLTRPLGQMFALESELAREVATALKIRLDTERPVRGGTTNVAAYDAYLRGKALYGQQTGEDDDRRALALLETAVREDPGFALAHAALSRILSSLAATTSTDSGELAALTARAVAEARRAVELAPDRAEGQLAMAYALFAGQLDARAAKPFYQRASRLGSGDADTLLLCALYQVRMRAFGEAREAARQAMALDPLNPRAFRAAGAVEFGARRYAAAVGFFDRALALNPKMTVARAQRAMALTLAGSNAEAARDLDREGNAMFGLTARALVAARSGQRATAEQALAKLRSDVGDAAMYQQAEVLAQLGRTDEAIAALQRAYALRDSGLTYVATDPFLDPVARDPRVIALGRRLGLA